MVMAMPKASSPLPATVETGWQITLREVGGSVMAAIPPAALNELGLGKGARVTLSVENNALIMKPVTGHRVGRIGLAARIAMCEPGQLPIDHEFDAASPVGDEDI
jgi:antitoxin ChpS